MFVLRFSWKVNAQNPPSQTISADSVHLSLDKLLRFPSSIQKHSPRLVTALKYPKAAHDAHKEGMTILGMVLNRMVWLQLYK